jgi:potassium/hydrogen antiporter
LNPLEYVRSGRNRNELVEITVPESSPVIGRQVVDLRLPRSALIVLLGRSDDFLVPRGSTVLQSDDVLLVLADNADIETVRQLVEPVTTIRAEGDDS